MKYIGKYKKTVTACLVAAFVCMFGSASTHAATLNVNSTADVAADDGQCTLREAISSVNGASSSGASGGECVAGDGNNDTIVLPAGTIVLTADFPALTAPMIIDGQGMGQTIIDADNGSYIVFSTGASLTVSDLSIIDFEGPAINAINADVIVRRAIIDGTNALNDVGFLVGVASLGADPALTVEDTTIRNIVSDDAPAVGGIFMGVANSQPAEVVIRRSTIANIEGPSTAGGIIFTTGSFDGNYSPANINATIENNTITGINSLDNTQNSASAAILLSSFLNGGENNFNFDVVNNTLTNVSHTSDGGAIFASIILTTDVDDVINAEINFTNNILASESSLGDCSINAFGDGTENYTVTSGGGNIVAGNTCTPVFTQPTDQNNVTNVAASLGPLSSNGGYVPTMALLDGSPALDTGVVVGGLTTDARGITRPQGVAYDSGAYEREVPITGGTLATLANTGEKIALYAAGGLLLVLVSGTVLLIARRR